jgi:hypothetical protein
VKLVAVALLLLAWATEESPASGGPSSRRAAGLQSAKIDWAAPTNGWPDKLWVYKVIAQDFSAAVLSNLLEIAALAEKDRAKPPLYLREADPKALYFSSQDGTRHLALCPSLGWIDFADEKAASASQLQPVEGVPGQAETTRLGLNYLRSVGVDISQIAAKPGTCDLDLHWERGTIGYVDQKTKNEVTLTNRFAVFFRRRIDGVNVGGIGLHGGAVVGFGNHAKVAELQVRWRNLKPYQLLDCVRPQEIGRRLKNGEIPLPSKAGPPEQITRLTITYAAPYYATKFGDEPEDYVAPRVDMVAVADRPGGPVAIQLNVPILRASP